MVSSWVTDSYLNNENIQIGDIELTNTAYGSSGSFGSILRSKSIGHNTYTDRRSNLRSKPSQIYGPVHKIYLNYSYSRSHLRWLPHAVTKETSNCLSQKVRYNFMMIDPLINGFITNEVKIHLHIYDNPIVIFCVR